MPKILDMTAGNRSTWHWKDCPYATFLDKRKEEFDVYGQHMNINPDIVGEWKALPFEDETFDLVYFDPPHLFDGNESIVAKKYTTLNPKTWRKDFQEAFEEAWRVTKKGGFLQFKWCESRIKISEIDFGKWKKLFGTRTGKSGNTIWIICLKEENETNL